MRSRTAGVLVLELTFLLACGDGSSAQTEPDAGGQPPADASVVDGGDGEDGGVDAGLRACGELVTEVQGDVSSLVVDGPRLYWLEIADEGVTFIKRSNQGGGVVDVAAFELGSITEFVVADDTVAYSEVGGVWVVPPVGDPVQLSDVGAFRGQVAADADRVYWVDPVQPQSGRVVLARPVDGSTEAVEIPIDFDEDGAIEDLAVDDAGLYFFDGVNSAAMRAPREGGTAQPLGTSGRSTIEELAVIGEHVYWVGSPGTELEFAL